jgi:hypothetical protein
MAYYHGGSLVGYDNRAAGSKTGRENLVSQTASPMPDRPVETGLHGAVKSVTSISRSSQTATVTATSHGITAGNIFRVSGAVQPQYNGEFKALTVADANTITYAVFGSPTTPATGTIKLRKVRTLNRDGK